MTESSLPLDVPVEPVQPVEDAQPADKPKPASAANRLPVYVAAVLVVVMGGAGLFSSGFLLGRQSALAPGAGDSRQAAFQPFFDTYNDIMRPTWAPRTSMPSSKAQSRACSRRWATPSRST